MTFKTGDRVRMSQEYKEAHPEDTHKDAKATIRAIATDWNGGFYIDYDDGSEGIAYPKELELVEEPTTFKIGDRVRCINTSPYKGLEGTVSKLGYDGISYGVEWDGKEGPSAGFGQGGWWSAPSLELVPPRDYEAEIEALTEHYAELLAIKDAGLKIASFAFGQYAKLHYAKATPESTMKALTNAGLQRMMDDALEAD